MSKVKTIIIDEVSREYQSIFYIKDKGYNVTLMNLVIFIPSYFYLWKELVMRFIKINTLFIYKFRRLSVRNI